MRLRIRFVLILTLVVTIIVLFAFYVIYTASSYIRKLDFDKRLWANAYSEYLNYYNITETDSTNLNKLAYYLPGLPIDLELILLDNNFNIIKTVPDTLQFKIDTIKLKKAREWEQLNLSTNDFRKLAFYFDKGGKESYAIAAGYDKYGFARLSTLRIIIGVVAGGCILVIGLFALYYVMVITRPLADFNLQMSNITANNLTKKIYLGRGNIKNNEIVQMATAFNNMLDRLEKAFQLQKNFVHHASHELRTPLATMLSQTESALGKELKADEAKKVLESLKEDQQEMIDLTNSLLLLSQYENVQNSNWPKIRVDETFYDAIASAQKMFNGILITFNFHEEPEKESYLCIRGNETLLRSAVRNLIKNAYHYSEDKRVDITMHVDQTAVYIHIENTGPVIKTEDREQIFLPFFRSDNAYNKKGSGLGLSIVKRIIELHKGTVNYDIVNENTNRFTLIFFRK